MTPWWHEPFFQVGLPVMLTFIAATWYQGKRLDDLRSDLNKRFDEINKRLDEIVRRLERVEAKLDGHAERIAKLEERTGPIRR
jgi:predicted nuclease with TOPRIM domain